jgi:hypothetical protein
MATVIISHKAQNPFTANDHQPILDYYIDRSLLKLKTNAYQPPLTGFDERQRDSG